MYMISSYKRKIPWPIVMQLIMMKTSTKILIVDFMSFGLGNNSRVLWTHKYEQVFSKKHTWPLYWNNWQGKVPATVASKGRTGAVSGGRVLTLSTRCETVVVFGQCFGPVRAICKQQSANWKHILCIHKLMLCIINKINILQCSHTAVTFYPVRWEG